jgi:predicted AAA+ superfamily ATPase
MIEREITGHVRQVFQQYPVVTLTGPRQSGKTTLCRSVFPDAPYVNLEAIDEREAATEDPRGFLSAYSDGAILDEIQRVPSLTSYIQVRVDEVRRNGLFVLTGSQQLEISQTVGQSLAGRTAVVRLLPFSVGEANQLNPAQDLDTLLYTGFYPRIYDQRINPTQALADYFETYVERDLRQLSELRNLSAFQRFVRICAGRVGQLLNTQSLGADVGVSHTTVRQWLSLLEASYVVFLLYPYHGNLAKRLIKSPKLYFHDVGLAAYLLGIENAKQMTTHPLRGNLFENCVVIEALKHRYNTGRTNNLYFYRDSAGHEVDLIYMIAQHPVPIEIKAGQTVVQDFFKGLSHFENVLGSLPHGGVLVYGADKESSRHGVRVIGLRGLSRTLDELDRP